MLKNRLLFNKLKLFAENFKVVLLLGARQVGKSTLLSMAFPHVKNIVFDAFRDEYRVKEDPDQFLNNFPSPLILDEVQYMPELLSSIKRHVDRNENFGQYFLTGSQNINMVKTIAESMSGRVGIMQLSGMTHFEINNYANKSWLQKYLEDPNNILNSIDIRYRLPIYQTLWCGTLPGILKIDPLLITDFYASYVQTYIERDVRMLENIRDLSLFDRFLGIAAALTAQEINQHQLGREIGLSPSTSGRWLELLKNSYLWLETFPYFGNTVKRISKKRKGYFFDTGLACYLQRVPSAEALSRHPLLGALFESYCVNMIMTLAQSLPIAPRFYHWRSNSSAEVDLILDYNGCLYPIEIKCKTILNKRDSSGIQAFRATYPNLSIAKGIILYDGDIIQPLDHNTIMIPWFAVSK